MYGYVEQFDLQGWAPTHQSAFAMGVEWQQFHQRLQGGAPFTMSVLRANAKRLADLALRHGRFNETHTVNDHYARITVGGCEIL